MAALQWCLARFSSFAFFSSVLRPLVLIQSIFEAWQRPLTRVFDGFRASCGAPLGRGPVIQVWIPFDSLTTRAAAARAAHHRWLHTGTCDDEYSSACWPSACRLQRTGAHGQHSHLVQGLPRDAPPPRTARNPRAACDGPRGRKSPRPATTACARISETWTPNSS